MVDIETLGSIDSDIHYNFIGSYLKSHYHFLIVYTSFSSDMYN